MEELSVSSATRTEHVFRRHFASIEAQRMRVRRMPTQLAIRLEHVVARHAGGHQQRADFRAARDVVPAVRYELLGAVDYPCSVARLRARLGGPGFRTRFRFGQTK